MKSNLDINLQPESSIPLREPNSDDDTHIDNSDTSFQCNIPNDLGSRESPIEGPRQKLYHLKRRTTCILVTLSIWISLISLVLSAIAIGKYTEAADELRIARESRGRLCLPCDEQKIQLQSWKHRNERGECCVKLEEIIYLINQVVTARVKETRQEEMNNNAAEHSSFSPVLVNQTGAARHTAHFLLERDQLESNDAYSSDVILRWINPSQDSTVAHMSSSIQYLNSHKVQVTESGFYYIYCQITVFVPRVDDAQEASVRYSIMKETQGHSSLLAQRNEMVIKSLKTKQFAQQVLYLGGAFKLHSGDKVYVWQNNGYQVINNNYDTYFGLYRL